MPFTLLTDEEGKELPTSCLPTNHPESSHPLQRAAQTIIARTEAIRASIAIGKGYGPANPIKLEDGRGCASLRDTGLPSCAAS
jgi:hypothetical protein